MSARIVGHHDRIAYVPPVRPRPADRAVSRSSREVPGQLWEREAERRVTGVNRPAYVIAVYNAAIKRDTERTREGLALDYPLTGRAPFVAPFTGGRILRGVRVK